MRNRQQLKQVLLMLVIDAGLGVGVVADAGADVLVQDGVGEAEVVLVALVGEAVGWGLLHQLDGQAQLLPYRLHFLHDKTAQRREIAGGIAVTG